MELEQRLIEAKLRQQQLQSEADSRWLHQEESNLVSYLQTFMTTMLNTHILFRRRGSPSHTRSGQSTLTPVMASCVAPWTAHLAHPASDS